MSKTVVIIDDDGITLDLMESIIEDNFDAGVFSFTDAKTAQSFILEQGAGQLDLIISDVIMPRYNGFELIAHLRREGVTLPVLLVSAEVTKDDAVKAKQFKVSGYLIKPISKDDFVGKVKPLLG